MKEHNVPRLAVGNPGLDDYGCAMQIISWENGDDVMSDYPDNVALPLARAVQAINDHYCAHSSRTTGDGVISVELLCASCSEKVLALAHRTTDTKPSSMAGMWSWTARLLERTRDCATSERALVALRMSATLAQAMADGKDIEELLNQSESTYMPYMPSLSFLDGDDVNPHDLCDVHVMDMARSVRHIVVECRDEAVLMRRLERCLCGLAASFVTVTQRGDRELMLQAGHDLVDLWRELVTAPEPDPAPEHAVNDRADCPAVAA